MKNNPQVFLLILMLAGVAIQGACMGSAQAGSSAERGMYLAERGIIIPAEEIHTDSYIGSIDYNYPKPQSEMGITLYNSTSQMNSGGQEGILQIGIQGRSQSFESLPPMNLAFVVDTASSMGEEEKIEWVKEAATIFMRKIRDIDYLSLVSFNDTSQVLFESTRMDTAEKRQRFLNAVMSLSPRGGTNLEAGLKPDTNSSCSITAKVLLTAFYFFQTEPNSRSVWLGQARSRETSAFLFYGTTGTILTSML